MEFEGLDLVEGTVVELVVLEAHRGLAVAQQRRTVPGLRGEVGVDTLEGKMVAVDMVALQIC